MAGRFSIEAVFKAVDKVTAPVSRMQNKVGKFTRSAGKGFQRLTRGVGKFTKSLKKVGLVGAASLLLVSTAMAGVITTGADFGRAIGSAAAKFPDQIKRGTDEFKALERAARDVGATTEFTSTQAAGGLNFLAKAGFNAKFSIGALPAIVDFATASELDFATAADIASDALGAFGLDSQDSAKKMLGLNRVMDVMSKTANSTNTSVSELFEAVKDGAPIAASAGVSIETFSATMGFLASNGIKAAKAGTAAKNITLALAGIGNKAAQTFSRLGISLADSNGELRDQFDVLDDLRGALKGAGSQEKLAIMESIFGKIPLAAASKLIDDTAGSTRKLRRELEAAGGSSKKTAAFIRNDVKGSMDGLTSAIEGVKISIFSLNEGPLKKAIDRMTDWVRANEELIATRVGDFLLNIVTNFESIVKWGVRIGAVIAIFFALNAVLSTLTGILTLVNLVMAANPIGLMIIGVAALIGLVTLLVVKWEAVKDFFTSFELPDFLKSNFDADFDPESSGTIGAGISPPQDRLARSIEEQRTTSSADVTIRDETGRAEVTRGSMGNGLALQSSGEF